VLSVGVGAPLMIWLTLGLRRAYGDGRLAAAAKALLLVFGLMFVLAAYRALLFFTVLFTT
jgi:hypothetical protein